MARGQQYGCTVFIDDSFSPSEGHLFAAIIVPDEIVAELRALWDSFRRELTTTGIPLTWKLHAVHMLGERRLFQRRFSSRSAAAHTEHMRETIRHGLGIIGRMTGVEVVVYWREEPVSPGSWASFWWSVANDLSENLTISGRVGKVIIDGNETNDHYGAALRQISTEHGSCALTRVTVKPSTDDGLLQAADFVAHSAYQSIAKKASRDFMWTWLETMIPQVRVQKI